MSIHNEDNMNMTIQPGLRRAAHARGFSLIELMVVVAIVAILAAVAIPSYRDYVLRARLTAMLSELSGGKAGVESLVMEGPLSATLTPADVGLRSPTELCGDILFVNRPEEGELQMICSNDSLKDGGWVELWYSPSKGWSCKSASRLYGWAPASCEPMNVVFP